MKVIVREEKYIQPECLVLQLEAGRLMENSASTPPNEEYDEGNTGGWF